MTLLVGLVDSGLAPDQPARAAVHVPAGAGDPLEPARPDHTGHGSDMARIILAAAPMATLLLAQVFDDRPVTRASRVARAVDWLVGRRAAIVLLSLGLRQDDDLLRAACARAVAAGLDLIAAAPPRGAAVFPAAYPGVIAVCGDARCPAGLVSSLGGEPADFGASPHGPGARRGASCAAAAVAGLLAAWRAEGGRGRAADHLSAIASWSGRERRAAAVPA